MLRSFRVENHKSIRDEQELVFIPQYDKSKPVVPVAAIFGANASGKSNLLDALRWLQDAVRHSYASWEAGTGVPRTPFRLDPGFVAKPSGYCVDLLIDGLRHNYGVIVDDEQVREEWLHTFPRGRRRTIFERDRDGVRLGSTVADRRGLGELLGRQTRGNALFLSVAAQNDVAEVQALYQWFRTAIVFGDVDRVDEASLVGRIRSDPEHAAIVSLILAADLGLTDLRLSEPPADLRLTASLLNELVEVGLLDAGTPARRFASGEPIPQAIADQLQDEKVKAFLRRIAEIRDPSRTPKLVFFHGESDVPLLLEDQSAGTRSWIALVSDALTALDTGGLLVVDEVDASLHPLLSAQLIGLFHEADSNPSGGQLLFTTHDATLLEGYTLERDEVWFVEKESTTGATNLFALSEFHPRKGEDTAGRYLAGAYGAVPVMSGFDFREPIRLRRERDEVA